MCERDDNGERWDVFNVSTPKARKARPCSGCGGAIKPGTRYVRFSALYDGHWSNAALCLSCKAVSDRFQVTHPAGAWPDELRDELRACVLEEPESGEAAEWRAAIEAMDKRKAGAADGRRGR